MKILSIEQIREADRYTIENEPISSEDLMERAAGQVFEWLMARVTKEHKVKIFCGNGNNGGDGLVVARRLTKAGIPNQVYMLPDLHSALDFPTFGPNEIIVDALFGSGLNRPVEGVAAELINYLNQQKAIRVSIDIASGLFADAPSPNAAIFRPDYTLTFQMPKLAFLMPENDPYVGQLEVLDIKLHPQYLLEVTTNNFLVDNRIIRPIIHKRTKYSHKGTYGHALLVAGSEGKTGAAILGAKSCLRTGAGLLSVKLPQSAWTPLQASLPEAMIHTDDKLDAFNAIGVGPGLGTSEDAQRTVKRLIQDAHVTMVMDADALNLLGENKTWLPFLPPKTILPLTPRNLNGFLARPRRRLNDWSYNVRWR